MYGYNEWSKSLNEVCYFPSPYWGQSSLKENFKVLLRAKVLVDCVGQNGALGTLGHDRKGILIKERLMFPSANWKSTGCTPYRVWKNEPLPYSLFYILDEKL